MSGSGTGYDLETNIYNPEGKVFQIEYASKATDGSGTIVGMVCNDGILLGAEKQVISKMLVPGTNRRTNAIHKNASIVFTGVIPDARNIIGRARQEAAAYEENYGKQIPSRVLAERIASFIHIYTLYGVYRPFGVVTILASVDSDQTRHLYMIEPSGQFFEYYASTAGKGRQVVKTELDKLDLANLNCRESVYHVAKMLHKTHDEAKDRQFELEITWICQESNFETQFVPADLLEAEEERAKNDIENEELGD